MGDSRFSGCEFVRKGKSGDCLAEIAAGEFEVINKMASLWLSLFKNNVTYSIIWRSAYYASTENH